MPEERYPRVIPISSMKIIVGWSFWATLNTAAASFCDSPYHLSVRFDTCRLMNLCGDYAQTNRKT